MKKISILIVSLTVMALMVVLYGLSSCKQTGEKTQEKVLEKTLEQGGAKNADVDIDDQKITIESEEGKMQINAAGTQWPKEAPSEVPELKAGEIAGTTASESAQGRNWSVRYMGLNAEELDRYGALLKSKGFKISTIKGPKGGMVTGEKDNITVIFAVSDKVSSLNISVLKQE